MKTLKNVLQESILQDPELSLQEMDIVANKVDREIVKAYIKSKISGNSAALIATDEIFELIPKCCLKRSDTEKKGSMWSLLVPEPASKNHDQKPIYVCINKGLYRESKGAEKETYNTTASAMHKRYKNIAKFAVTNGIGNGWIQGQMSLWGLTFFMNEYTKVDSVGDNGWYTYVISLWNRGNKTQYLVSINTDTKQWTWGATHNIPKFAFNGNNVSEDFIWASDAIYKIDRATNGEIQVGSSDKKCIINALPHGDIADYKKTKNDWLKVHFTWNDIHNKNVTENTLYINKNTFNYLTYADVNGTPSSRSSVAYTVNQGGTRGQSAALTPQEEIKEIKTRVATYKLSKCSLSAETVDYIKSNYKKVDNAGANKTWYKVYQAGTDAKYGSFMICIDTKEWRNTSFDEFYGGGVVD